MILFNPPNNSIDLWPIEGEVRQIPCKNNRIAGRLYPMIMAGIQAQEEAVISVMVMIRGIEEEIKKTDAQQTAGVDWEVIDDEPERII